MVHLNSFIIVTSENDLLYTLRLPSQLYYPVFLSSSVPHCRVGSRSETRPS